MLFDTPKTKNSYTTIIAYLKGGKYFREKDLIFSILDLMKAKVNG